MPTRTLGTATSSPAKKIQAPERREDWNQLLRKAISAAESAGDRRLEGLRRAQVTGSAEAHLRRLGIIHTGDLEREFVITDSK